MTSSSGKFPLLKYVNRERGRPNMGTPEARCARLSAPPSTLTMQIGSTSWVHLCYKSTPQHLSISSTSTINRAIIDNQPWTVTLLLLALLLFWLHTFVCACSLGFLTRQVWPGHTCRDKKEALCARTPFFTSSSTSAEDGQFWIFLKRKTFYFFFI